jgi:serine/tyrosine/threonine adenylyltransferase
MPPDFNSPLSFSNLFSTLPPQFYTKLQPTPLPNPYLVGTSESAAQLLGLDTREFNSEDYVALFTGNTIADKSEPLAAVYSGHQFGHWAGQLGDGRAILLGDLGDKNSAQRWEVQLKGAGMTPYSRMGDGRAVLRSSIREFLCSEAMAHLGIPTSRALCVTGSDQMVWRETPETTAVVTRLAPTFIRFGSFQHWYYKGDAESLQTLADFVLQNYFPELLSAENPYQALLTEITKRTAELMAHWQAVGFMHGVMNTDNMSILGITLDYGPYGFMEAFDANHICNHTDQQGRYAYNMQPQIGQWNCHALGQAMLPLIGNVKDTEAALAIYPSAYEQKWSQLLHQKFGLELNQDGDDKLFDSFFDLMQANHADFTLVFRRLGSISKHDAKQDETLRDLFIDRPALDAWLANYRTRLQAEPTSDEQRKTAMNAVNPKYVLRNYLAQIAIEKAQKKDFSEVDKLLKILEHPFDEQPENESYAALPPDWANELEVSCSS